MNRLKTALPIEPGATVRFLPGTPHHDNGFRMGVVVRTDQTRLEHVAEQEARYGVSLDGVRATITENADACWPVVRVHPGPEMPAGGATFSLPSWMFEVIAGPEEQLSN